jgi:alanyl-tRNA synthetase
MRNAAAQAGSSEVELPGIVAGYRERIKTLEYCLHEAQDRVAELRAESLSASSNKETVLFAEAEPFDAALALARALARLGRVCLVVCMNEYKIVASSPANDKAGIAVDALFAKLAKARGGKGGGGKTLFQAAFPNETSLSAFLADAKLDL